MSVNPEMDPDRFYPIIQQRPHPKTLEERSKNDNPIIKETLELDTLGDNLFDEVCALFDERGVFGEQAWMSFITAENPDQYEPAIWRNPKEVLIMLDRRPKPEIERKDGALTPIKPIVRVRIIAIERQNHEDKDNKKIRRDGEPYITEQFHLDSAKEAIYFMDMAPTDKEIEAPDENATKLWASLFAIHDKELSYWKEFPYTPMVGIAEDGVIFEKTPSENLDMLARHTGTPPRPGMVSEVKPVVFPYGFGDENSDRRYALDKAFEILDAIEDQPVDHHSNE